MCTAATYKTKDFYFGRTLDYEFSYGDEVTVTPRNYPFHFRHIGTSESHYAMIGMAYVAENCPLYYDAVNERVFAWRGSTLSGTHITESLYRAKTMWLSLNLLLGFSVNVPQ